MEIIWQYILFDANALIILMLIYHELMTFNKNNIHFPFYNESDHQFWPMIKDLLAFFLL